MYRYALRRRICYEEFDSRNRIDVDSRTIPDEPGRLSAGCRRGHSPDDQQRHETRVDENEAIDVDAFLNLALFILVFYVITLFAGWPDRRAGTDMSTGVDPRRAGKGVA